MLLKLIYFISIIASFLFIFVWGKEEKSEKNKKLSNSSSAKNCAFGNIPGYWNLEKKTGEKFSVIDSKCELKNFMKLDIFKNTSNNKRDPVRILFLSDSVDAFIIKSVCNTFRTESQWWSLKYMDNFNTAFRFDSFNSFEFGRFQIGMRYIPGVHPTGPYHMDLIGGFFERSRMAKREFLHQFSAHPDVIIIGSNYWDAARLYLKHNISGSNNEGLEKSYIVGYMNNLTMWINHIRNIYGPKYHIIYHTHPQPAPNAYSQIFNSIIWDEFNSAGKTTAMKLGLDIIDYDKIARPFPVEVLMKPDGLHPNDWFGMEIFNVILNIVFQTYRHII